MTLDEKTLLTKIHTHTKLQTGRLANGANKVNLVVNMDFEKWNSYMREEEILIICMDSHRCLPGLMRMRCSTHLVSTWQMVPSLQN